MLGNAKVATRLPAQDLERARAFYAEKLGLEPIEERPGWEVDDIEATVAELRERGVEFEEVDLPGLMTVDGIAEVDGN